MAGRCRMPNVEHCRPRQAALRVCMLAAALAIAAPAFGQAPVGARDPEPAVALPWAGPARTAATAKSYMVAAANPVAVEAGLEMLRAGGSAADAAIAVQLVLNLVEPQSSGIGGGAFALHWQAATRRLQTYDGRETAPAAAKPDRFLEDGQPLPFGDAVFGGLSVGVPGTVRLLEALHKEHGRLPWAQLFAPAIRRGRAGLPRLAAPEPSAALVRGAEFRAAGAGVFLRPQRQRARRGQSAQEPRARRHAARDRRARRRRLLRGRHRAGHRRGRAPSSRPPGRHHARRPRGLPRQGARAGLLRLPAQPHLRHGAALVGWAGGGPDPEDGGGLRPGPRSGGRTQPARPASARRGAEARVRRPRPLRGRPGFRDRCREACSMRPTSAPGAGSSITRRR